MADDPPSDLTGRLRAASETLLGRALAPGETVGIAVSGGADSIALLDCARLAWPGQVEAATVNHGLRAEAAEEAEMVARFCERWSIPHETLVPDAPITGSPQAQARIVRYALLENWRTARGIGWLMTAHHADDQTETMLMRLSRGSGVGGLAGIRARRDNILRPLLGERRQMLRDWCIVNNLRFVDDPSNVDSRFDRARLRTMIGGADLIHPGGLGRSVEALAQADDALSWTAHMLGQSHIAQENGAFSLTRTDFPAALLRRLLENMLASANPDAEIPRGPSMDQALVQLLNGKTVTLADCVVSGGSGWTVRRAPPRRSV